MSVAAYSSLITDCLRRYTNKASDSAPGPSAFGRKAIQCTQFTSGHRIYIASLAQAGQIKEAREALARVKELFPEMSIAWIKQYVPYPAGPMDKFLEGMRKAGLE